jgi:hypothetical protein
VTFRSRLWTQAGLQDAPDRISPRLSTMYLWVNDTTFEWVVAGQNSNQVGLV